MTTEATRFSPPSKSVPALVISWWFWETKWLTYSLHSLQFLTNFLDSFLATLLLGLGPPVPGVVWAAWGPCAPRTASGTTCTCGARAHSDSSQASGLGFWIRPQTNSCVPSWPFQIPVGWFFFPPHSHSSASEFKPRHTRCLLPKLLIHQHPPSWSRGSLLTRGKLTCVSVFIPTEHMQHRWLLLTFDLGQGYSTGHLAPPASRAPEMFSFHYTLGLRVSPSV